MKNHKKLSGLLVLLLATQSVLAEVSYCPSDPNDPGIYNWQGSVPPGWEIMTLLPQYSTSGPSYYGKYNFLYASFEQVGKDANQITCTYNATNNPLHPDAYYEFLLIKSHVHLDPKDIHVLAMQEYVNKLKGWAIPNYEFEGDVTRQKTDAIKCLGKYGQVGATTKDCPFNSNP